MSAGQLQLFDDLVLDARRVAWLPREATLVVPDVHLGFAWTQRFRGSLLPVETPDDTLDRLAALQADYHPRRILFLGDLVHAALDVPMIRAELDELVARLGRATELVLTLGNHDRRLPNLLAEWKLPVRVEPALTLGRFRLLHGDLAAAEELLASPDRLTLIGHEHPSLTLGDGVATSARCPAFLLADDTVVLPAFSNWASGCNVARGEFLGPVAGAAKFHTAVACVGSRLLRLPLRRGSIRGGAGAAAPP